jgi:hypothetical protein
VQAEDIEKYLTQLGKELVHLDEQRPFRVFLIGGDYMMLLANAPRSTDDIDIFWLENEETLQQALRALRDGVRIVAHNSCYSLATPWWHTHHPHSSSPRKCLKRETPEPFTRRNIFCGNRPYQNKYEMSARVQEARAKGITDPGEVWRYARKKEISIHGA